MLQRAPLLTLLILTVACRADVVDSTPDDGPITGEDAGISTDQTSGTSGSQNPDAQAGDTDDPIGSEEAVLSDAAGSDATVVGAEDGWAPHPDTRPPDTGPIDTGPADTVIVDTGPADTGPPDTGLPDTGPPDTGIVDAGPTA